jgi:hypothetical protein
MNTPKTPAEIGELARNFRVGLERRSRYTHSYFVLASTAIISNRLNTLLTKAMRPLSKSLQKKLFEATGGPLSTFSGSILVAYAFKLINEETFRTLEKVRKVRNHFAHTTERIDLDTAELQPMLFELGWKSEGATNLLAKLQWWVDMLKGVEDILVARETELESPPSSDDADNGGTRTE